MLSGWCCVIWETEGVLIKSLLRGPWIAIQAEERNAGGNEGINARNTLPAGQRNWTHDPALFSQACSGAITRVHFWIHWFIRVPHTGPIRRQINQRINPLSPHDALEQHFASLKRFFYGTLLKITVFFSFFTHFKLFSFTTSRELRQQFAACSGWRWQW